MISCKVLTCLLGISICFVQNAVAYEAIVNGQKAVVDQFPYQVALMHNGRNFCGGGIIGEQFIITAAHCVLDNNNNFYKFRISIIAGTNDLQRINSTFSAHARKIFVLKDYVPLHPFQLADIAVIKLNRRLELSKHIEKLELPKRNEKFAGKKAVIAGFGRHSIQQKGNNTNNDHSDTHLRYIEEDILDYFPDGNDKIAIPDDLMHAKVTHPHHHEPRGVCVGDSGSPLVHGNIVVGILNKASPMCKEIDAGGIYAPVSFYLDFVHDALHEKSHDNIRVHEITD